MRPLPKITGRGVIALILLPMSAITGALLGAEELVLLSIALGTSLVLGAIQCWGRFNTAREGWHLTVHLDAADIPCGATSTVTVGLTAKGRASVVPVRLEDPSAEWDDVTGGSTTLSERIRMPSLSSCVPLPVLADGGSARLRFPVPTAHRGIFSLQGARLWCFDSLGLFGGLVTSGPSATVTVLPVPAAVQLAPGLLRGDDGDEQIELLTPRAPRRQHNLGDFAGLRPYVPGDRLRLLYWPALARSGELLVRDFDDTSSHRFHLLADVRAHLGARGTEAVLATAAGAGLAALQAGAIVEFATTGGDSVAIGPGPLSDLALLRAIAAVAVARPPHRQRFHQQPSSDRGGHGEVFARADVVVTTTGGANSLPAALRHGHLVIA